jgi:hypothetical protein
MSIMRFSILTAAMVLHCGLLSFATNHEPALANESNAEQGLVQDGEHDFDFDFESWQPIRLGCCTR